MICFSKNVIRVICGVDVLTFRSGGLLAAPNTNDAILLSDFFEHKAAVLWNVWNSGGFGAHALRQVEFCSEIPFFSADFLRSSDGWSIESLNGISVQHTTMVHIIVLMFAFLFRRNLFVNRVCLFSNKIAEFSKVRSSL